MANKIKMDFKVFTEHADGTISETKLVKTEYHCPNCGKKHVWVEDNEGDYYVGASLYCIKCKFEFYLPSGYINDELKIGCNGTTDSK